MPYFVAAVKSSRRASRTKTWGQPPSSPATCELGQPTLGDPTSPDSPGSEVSWIKRNLRRFYSESEPTREQSFLSRPRRRAYSMEEAAQSPTNTMEDRTSPLNTIPNGVEKSFKSRRSLSSRQKDVADILSKHPHKIPIIVERSKNEKQLGILDKSKFLVPEELTMSQLCTIIRRRLQLNDSHSFYLMVNRRSMASATTTLAEIYKSEKDDDGFLYITYASQEMFG